MVEAMRVNARSAARAVANAQLDLKQAREGYANESQISVAQAEGRLEVAAERLAELLRQLDALGMPSKASHGRPSAREHGTSL